MPFLAWPHFYSSFESRKKSSILQSLYNLVYYFRRNLWQRNLFVIRFFATRHWQFKKGLYLKPFMVRYKSFYLHLYVCRSVCLSLVCQLSAYCLFSHCSFSLFTQLSVCCLSVSLFGCLCVCLLVQTRVCLSACLPVCLSLPLSSMSLLYLPFSFFPRHR